MLTKSDLLLYKDAPLHLWALKNDRYKATQVSAHQQFLRLQSEKIESLAVDYVAARFKPSPAQPRAPTKDRQASPGGPAAGRSPARIIAQPTYTSGRYLARLDFLLENDDGSASLVEVKSSTSVKEDHRLDAAFQVLVVADHHPIDRVYLLHLNPAYTLQGALDPHALLSLVDETEAVLAKLEEVDRLRRQALAACEPQAGPDLARTGGCTNPRTCPCVDLCFPTLPEFPVFHLPRLGQKARALVERGITAIRDIPPEFPLTENQRRHAAAAVEGEQVDRSAIRAFLSSIQPPIHFLDFETFPPGLPVLDGYRPYEHVVFQFSMQVLDQAGAAPSVRDYLHTEASDPAPALVAALRDSFSGEGAVLAWNAAFEKARLRELAARLPEHAAFLQDLAERTIDLMSVFSRGHYVHRDFRGSASLKSVLPVLVPAVDYASLTISQGDQAMLAWHALAFEDLPQEDRDRLSDELVRYCRQDTLGMAAIFNLLADIASGKST